MSASSLTYATGGGFGAPCGSSFGSGVRGERFCAAVSVPALGGGAPRSSPDVTSLLGAVSPGDVSFAPFVASFSFAGSALVAEGAALGLADEDGGGR